MSRRRDKPPPRAGRSSRNAKVKPSLIYRLWRLAVEHPRGVLIAAATLLGLIVVLRNWEPTRAKLLVWEPELPFIVWALIFMLVGYLTGKWIEWAIGQRRIRKGTYRPRASAEDLAGTAAALDEKLADTAKDEEDPATIIDRRGQDTDAPDDAAVERVDYWDDADGRPDDRAPDRIGDRDVPARSRSRSGEYSPAAQRTAGPAPSRYRGDRGGDRYGDYNDYGEVERYGDYGDYQDGGGRRGGGRDGGRYSDYSDYSDYQDGGGRRSDGRRK
jgi:uncharacterized integral membrane protein